MRRSWRWLIGGGLLIATLGSATAVYLLFIDRSWSRTRLYADTGLDPSTKRSDDAVFVPRPGRITLFLERGEREEPFTYDSGSGRTIAVEIPTPSGGERIDLSAPGVRSGFVAYGGMAQWKVGARGITGEIEIEEATPRRVTAKYRIRVDAYCDRFTEGHRNHAMDFAGRTVFRAGDPPHGEIMGYIWPAP